MSAARSLFGSLPKKDRYIKIISGNDGHSSSSVRRVVHSQSHETLHRKRRADHADSSVTANAVERQALARPQYVQGLLTSKSFRLKLQN